MHTAFLEEPTQPPAVRFSLDFSVNPEPERESVRLLAIGSRQEVMSVIYKLHKLNFAEVGAWSPLLPGPNPGEVMSILTLNFAIS
ncbi:MAG: hypothetical protein WCA35_03130 [Kovacikia sp.]